MENFLLQNRSMMEILSKCQTDFSSTEKLIKEEQEFHKIELIQSPNAINFETQGYYNSLRDLNIAPKEYLDYLAEKTSKLQEILFDSNSEPQNVDQAEKKFKEMENCFSQNLDLWQKAKYTPEVSAVTIARLKERTNRIVQDLEILRDK